MYSFIQCIFTEGPLGISAILGLMGDTVMKNKKNSYVNNFIVG